MSNELTTQGKVEGIWIDISLFSNDTPKEQLEMIRSMIGFRARKDYLNGSKYFCKVCDKDLQGGAESGGNEVKLCECLVDKISA